jgi:hypothetical protein
MIEYPTDGEGWVSVKDALPATTADSDCVNDSEPVLVTVARGQQKRTVEEAYLQVQDFEPGESPRLIWMRPGPDGDYVHGTVTHWRPMPDPARGAVKGGEA